MRRIKLVVSGSNPLSSMRTGRSVVRTPCFASAPTCFDRKQVVGKLNSQFPVSNECFHVRNNPFGCGTPCSRSEIRSLRQQCLVFRQQSGITGQQSSVWARNKRFQHPNWRFSRQRNNVHQEAKCDECETPSKHSRREGQQFRCQVSARGTMRPGTAHCHARQGCFSRGQAAQHRVVRHEVACVTIVRSRRNDTIWYSATSTLPAHAPLITAGCEAAGTMYPHFTRKVTKSREEVATTSSKVVKGLELRGMVNICESP